MRMQNGREDVPESTAETGATRPERQRPAIEAAAAIAILSALLFLIGEIFEDTYWSNLGIDAGLTRGTAAETMSHAFMPIAAGATDLAEMAFRASVLAIVAAFVWLAMPHTTERSSDSKRSAISGKS
jgi:hypothetical protein